jgi:MoaA/NifB/PqqE/SkfB family radical SAM enzyme
VNVTTAQAPGTAAPPTGFLWLDLTRKCQLACVHCYNASGPDGTHGTMTREHWLAVLDQAAACDVRQVQLIGGEPTMHPHAAELVEHGLDLGLGVEVFSNLVHVTARWWKLFRRDGVTVATSYYSDLAAEHNAMTGRPSHARTRANIRTAIRLGVSLRVGIISGSDSQRVAEARAELESLGVTRIGVDHVRPFGRGADEREPDPGALCGRCGTGRAAIGPGGEVTPCVFSDWLAVGNVRESPLADILGGAEMAEANAVIRGAMRKGDCRPRSKEECRPDAAPPCYPDRAPCGPDHTPIIPCRPDKECQPGYPTDKCIPDD